MPFPRQPPISDPTRQFSLHAEASRVSKSMDLPVILRAAKGNMKPAKRKEEHDQAEK
jgi:hypothetical protein